MHDTKELQCGAVRWSSRRSCLEGCFEAGGESPENGWSRWSVCIAGRSLTYDSYYSTYKVIHDHN